MHLKLVHLAILIWNLITFFLFGWDKLASKNRWKRIRESILLAVAFLFGGAGAMFGMVIWNHKTSKMKFRLLIPLFVIVNGVLLWILPL